MVNDLDRKIAKLERQAARIVARMSRMKRRHAHDLMNEARELLGKSPKPFGGAKQKRSTSKKTVAKKADNENGGKAK